MNVAKWLLALLALLFVEPALLSCGGFHRFSAVILQLVTLLADLSM